eukprot:TRINITY_DN10626_c0_g3_i2.p1 TRINITY_DN10626_c0_g3~~TRINITY_DN10626_c0_g3_i2.p1  ORF type:complete len:376 (+),score=77.24 TRINITY_DN10626_c0_g3_i2:167-1294(+)
MATATYEIIIRTSTTDGGDDLVLSNQHQDTTVRLLRQCVAHQHPCQPSLQQIRLIYSGRMLRDHETLNDVVRKDADTNKFVFHLVLSGAALHRSLSSPSSPATQNSDSTLRQRHAYHGASPTTPSPLSSHPSSVPVSPYAYYYQQYYQQMLQSSSPEYAHALRHWYTSQGLTPPATPSQAATPVQTTPTHPATGATDAPLNQLEHLNADNNNNVAGGADLGDANRFAQAGVGAAPMLGAEEAELEQAQQPRGAVQFLTMLGKLALFVALFGQGASNTKLMVLVAVAVVILLVQFGAFNLRRTPRPRPAAQAQAQQPEAQNDTSERDDNPNDNPNQAQPSDEAAAAPQPPSLVAGIGEVFITFFTSLLPPMAEAYA